ncbi:MAG: FAD-dependent oxidoreductase [Propionibacteriales bacterium]|nr:FAD-dependent oxidoreductase [Propionibacteriales bacterium]
MNQRFDVVVVGAGMAGWTAARRSQELGLSVGIVDKGPAPGACNARVSQGFMNAAYLSMREDPAVLRDYVREITSGAVDEDLLTVWSRTCGRALDWLQAQGVDVGTLPERRDRLYLLPFKISPQGLRDVDPERGPAATIARHERAFTDAGGQFLPESRAVELLTTDAGAVDGIRVRSAGGEREIRADGVVLADGGFAGNPEMLRRYVGPAADRMLLRSLATQTGDGIAMAVELGAATVNMQYFYGHMLSLDALTNDELWPYPLMDGAICDGILVRRDGRRFVDEQIAGSGGSRRAMSGIGVTNAVGQGDDPRDAIAILDASGWALKGWDEERGEFQGTYPANPTIADRGGRVHESDTLNGLAVEAGIAPDALEATVAEYNAAVRAAASKTLPVPRGGNPRLVEEAPFVAVPCTAAITYTLGGLHVTAAGRVRATGGGVVPGLYAAGGTAGGLAGGTKGGYTGGLGEALVFGLLAAEDIAASHCA